MKYYIENCKHPKDFHFEQPLVKGFILMCRMCGKSVGEYKNKT